MAEPREVYEQVEDETGRTGRFDPYLSGTEQEARSKRSTSSMRSRAG